MNSRGHLSSETLDLLSLSALAEPEGQKARAHLAACAACRQAWKELEADRQKFIQFVFPRTVPNVEARARPVPRWKSIRKKWALALPFAGLVAVSAAWILAPPRTAERPYFGVKGGARLEVVALKGERQVSVGNDTLLAPGDRIRFLVDPAGASYVLVASKDGNRHVTVYYPYEGAQSAPLQGGFQELPGSIELDAVGGKEQLFAVFSDAPLRADAVRAAIQHDEDLSKLPGVRAVATKEFVKESR